MQSESTPSFQPTLTQGITAEDLPQFTRCHDFLKARPFPYWEENLIQFVVVYGNIVNCAARGKTEPSKTIRKARRAWGDFMQTCNDMKDTDIEEGVSFEDLFGEFQNLLSGKLADSAQDWTSDAVEIRGKQLELRHAVTWELLQHCDLMWTEKLHHICDIQPVAVDHPSNYTVYVARKYAGQGDFFELDRVLNRLVGRNAPSTSQETKSLYIREILKYWHAFAALAVDLFTETGYTPTHRQADVFFDSCFDIWQLYTEDFMLHGPRAVRERMAHVNPRGSAEVMFHLCQQLVRDRGPQYMSWYLHLSLAENVVLALNLRLDPKHMLETWFPRDTPGPIPNFVVNARLQVDRAALDEATPAVFEPVRFVATGPELDPLDYSDQAQNPDEDDLCVLCQDEFGDGAVVKLRACGHLLHLECVRPMINNVEQAEIVSCPLCREEICPRRPRQPEP